MTHSFHRRVAALCVGVTAAVAPAYGQPETAVRTELGTAVDAGPDGIPAFREDSGWSSPSYGDATWAVEYGAEMNSSEPWVSVLQAGRTNAGLTASASKVTLDLGSSTYVIAPYDLPGNRIGGRFAVSDAGGTGATFKLFNGTLDNDRAGARSVIGLDGFEGRLFVERATLLSRELRIGEFAGAKGFLTVDGGGSVAISTSLSVGHAGTGTLHLRGTNATVVAPEINLGLDGGLGTILVSDPSALLRASNANGGTGDLVVTSVPGNGVIRIDAGTVQVDRNLRLAPNGSGQHGAVVVAGGTLKVGGTLSIGNNTTAANGGRVTLDGGRIEVATPGSVSFGTNPEVRKFYWRNGTLAFTSPSVSLSEVELRRFTAQGA